MSEHNQHDQQVNEADSRADAFAIFTVIMLAVATAIYFVSNQ